MIQCRLLREVLIQALVGVLDQRVILTAGISAQKCSRWQAKYAGLAVDQVR